MNSPDQSTLAEMEKHLLAAGYETKTKSFDSWTTEIADGQVTVFKNGLLYLSCSEETFAAINAHYRKQ